MAGDLDVRGDGPPPAGDVPPWCEQCGRAAADGDHTTCAARRALEPPRYCARCRRRMVVQVVPRGWSARCVEHGTLSG